MIYLRLYPNTSGPEGTPLIESLVNEIITMLRQSEHVMLQVDANEIPPGILVLTGIAYGEELFYEAAIIIALLGFVGTVSLAKFLLRGDIIE